MRHIKKLKIIAFITTSIVVIFWSLHHKPNIYGDGNEYLNMVISINQHVSPQLTESDVAIHKQIIAENKIPPVSIYSGYFPDLQKRMYSFHFWAYPLICSPFFYLLQIFKGNTLNVFQLTNSVLFLLSLGWILFRLKSDYKTKIWMLTANVVSPIWLYLHWSSPEVFSYSILVMGLVELLNRNKTLACLLTAIASLQNPAISLITAYIGIMTFVEMFRARKWDNRFITIFLSSSVVLIPYLWSYMHYHKFSLIQEKSTQGFDVNKAFNLLTDPNMGLFIYIPIIFFILVYLLIKRNIHAITWLTIMIVIALVCSKQVNWNSASSYIDRYAVWLIPIAIFSIIPFIVKVSKRTFIITVSVFALTTGTITATCIVHYDNQNYVIFQPLAKFILSVVPSIYNPPKSVIIKRSLNQEIQDVDSHLPITVMNNGEIRKTLTKVDGKYTYINYGAQLSSIKSFSTIYHVKAKEDIFYQENNVSFGDGWNNLEKWIGEPVRWIYKKKSTLMFGGTSGKATVTLKIGAFVPSTECQIIVNGVPVFEKPIESSTSFSVVADIKAINTIEINALDHPNNKLFFYVYGIDINNLK